jgi:hypothetical protein
VAAVEVGQLQQHLLPGRSGHDPLRQPLPDVRKHIAQPAGLPLPLSLEACAVQRGVHRIGGRLYAVLLVGEQVDVLGGPGNDPVGQQGVAAQREAVLGRRGQGNGGELAVQVTDRHQVAPAAAARSGG